MLTGKKLTRNVNMLELKNTNYNEKFHDNKDNPLEIWKKHLIFVPCDKDRNTFPNVLEQNGTEITELND